MKSFAKAFIVTLIITVLVIGTAVACNQYANAQGAAAGVPGDTAGENPSMDETTDSEKSNSAALSLQEKLSEAQASNPDTVAWLYLPDTQIDDPVVQAADNAYYLNRDAQGNYDVWGSYFADYLNDLSSRSAFSTNTVIYGHSYKNENPDERKFTQLFKYCDLDFVQEHPCIYLSVNGEDLVFQVTAVFFTGIDFDYIDPEPDDSFWDTVARKNEYVFDGLDFGSDDKVLTLSTCSHRYDTENSRDQRLVIMAKLLEAGEEPHKVTVTANSNPERP